MSDLLGGCREFEFHGQRYQVAPRDLFIERQFALWVMSEAAMELARLQGRVPESFVSEQKRIFNSKVSGKQFSWGSEDVHSASLSAEGQRHLLWLKMKRGEAKGGADCERELIDEIASDKVKWAELLDILYQQDYPDFFEQVILPERQQVAKVNLQASGQPATTSASMP